MTVCVDSTVELPVRRDLFETFLSQLCSEDGEFMAMVVFLHTYYFESRPTVQFRFD